ncbi:hypothetical protein [Nocardioides panzhihuensis]|uniref:DUF1795 domain-containing protein n=1 Tax=Nocardioides panzhihuensis TaxID=860243 RepID=A0A7Z0DR97_9ACTN|nr:hypothetical protein [Nocardioides panzhihuensis]NYI79876.1 hypothetical protein [Nocardioides panzhihuensis]
MTTAALVGCGGAEGPSGSPRSSTPPSAQASADASPTAASRVVEVNGAQLRVPADWSVGGGGTQRATISVPEDESGTSYGTGVFNADITLASDTEELAMGRANVAGGDAKRLPDVEFGGQSFFHLRELHGGIDSLDTYGTVINGSEVTVAWGFNAELATREQIDGWINQVMPTFKFEG